MKKVNLSQVVPYKIINKRRVSIKGISILVDFNCNLYIEYLVENFGTTLLERSYFKTKEEVYDYVQSEIKQNIIIWSVLVVSCIFVSILYSYFALLFLLFILPVTIVWIKNYYE